MISNSQMDSDENLLREEEEGETEKIVDLTVKFDHELFVTLPREVIQFAILFYMDGYDLWENIRLVNKEFHDLVHHPGVIKHIQLWWPYSVSKLLRNRETELRIEDFTLLEYSGPRSFFYHCLCKIQSIEELRDDIFLLKITKFTSYEDERKEMVERDSKKIPYHPNILPFITSNEGMKVSKKVLMKLVPDEKFFPVLRDHETVGFTLHWFGGILHSRRRNEDDDDTEEEGEEEESAGKYILDGEYIKARKEEKEFREIELVRIATSLLNGVCHLGKHNIAHSNLYLGKVIVDEKCEKVWITDFYCSIRNLENGIISKYDDQLYEIEDEERFFEPRGYVVYKPPELVDFEEEGEEEYMDYSKCDVFSVGVCAYNLIKYMWDDSIKKLEEIAPFGFVEEDGFKEILVHKREQKKYVEVGEYEELTDARIPVLIKKMLMVDYDQRITAQDAYKEWKDILIDIENKEKEEEKKKKLEEEED